MTPSSCRRVEEVENAEYATLQKPPLSMRGGAPGRRVGPPIRADPGLDSNRLLVAKTLCYAEPARRFWHLKQGSMGDISEMMKDIEQKITTWQREVDLTLIKSVWGAQVRTPEEDGLSEECVCEPP